MRKLIYAINVTIDGCCDHTKGIANEEIHDFFTDLMWQSGTLLYGRKTYDLMVPFWPNMAKDKSGSTKAMNDFAQAFDAVDKIVVVSKTLEKAEGKNTEIIRTNLKEEVLKLKQQPGKDISTGGVDLAGQLIELDLVDEFIIVVQPVLAGAGRRLFDHTILPEKLHLKLIDTKVFKTGGVALHYSK
ncbi:MAG: dihydrofolate reductase family protein [Niastella sp.]|nr:dihydrofolate reductase family protein [Niastella sp.]